MNHLHFFLLCLAGWINRNPQNAIEYLLEEVKVLKEQLGKRPRFNDDQRRRLATKAKRIGLQRLKEIAAIVTLRTHWDALAAAGFIQRGSVVGAGVGPLPRSLPNSIEQAGGAYRRDHPGTLWAVNDCEKHQRELFTPGDFNRGVQPPTGDLGVRFALLRRAKPSGLGNKIIRPKFAEFPMQGAVNCRKRLGELLRCCYREAA